MVQAIYALERSLEKMASVSTALPDIISYKNSLAGRMKVFRTHFKKYTIKRISCL